MKHTQSTSTNDQTYFSTEGKNLFTNILPLNYRLTELQSVDNPSDFNVTTIAPKELKILYVEDNICYQELARYILRNEGCFCTVGENGIIALEYLTRFRYDVVLMDLNMPVIDGYQLTRVIRDRLSLKVPIIALTTNTCDYDIKDCLDSGMDNHLGKPYIRENLLGMIDKWTNHKQKIVQMHST